MIPNSPKTVLLRIISPFSRHIKIDIKLILDKIVTVTGENMETNNQFIQMENAALKRLFVRSAKDIAKKSGVNFDGKTFKFKSLGIDVTVDYPTFSISPTLDMWHHLIILHYLDLADGSPVLGTLSSFSEYRDGLIRGGDFDRRAEKMIQNLLKGTSVSDLKNRCTELGGILIDSNADLSAKFYFMPQYPLTLKIWFADDEFEASGHLFTDISAQHYLSVEDAVTVGELLLTYLTLSAHGKQRNNRT